MPNRVALTQQRIANQYAYPLQVLHDRPLAYGRGNEKNGTIWNDLTPAKNNGAYVGGAGIALGQKSIFSRDPSTGFATLNFGSNVMLPLLTSQITNITLEGIFKIPDALQLGGFMELGDSTTGICFGIGGTTLTNAGVQLIAAIGNVGWYQSGFNLTPGIWYHIAVVLAGGNFLFYVAGSLVATIAAGTPFAPSGHSYIGTFGAHGPNAFYSDNAFYNYGLNSTQIATHALLAQ